MYYQIINNTSFETDTQPWRLIAYNNYTLGTPVVNITSPGYNDNSAVQLNLNSGNLTIDSHLTLVQDLSQRTVAFDNGLRLRAASEVKVLTGNSITDRVEVSLTLASSNGNLAKIHYVLASSTALPTNSTSDAYFAIRWLGSSPWITLDRDVTRDSASAFPAIFGSLSTVKDIQFSVFSTSQGAPTIDPRIRYYETGGDSYWNTTETVVFDPDADGLFNPSTDWILYDRGAPPPGQPLGIDLRVKYVDTNLNGRWDSGEPIVYDLKNEGIYDLAANDPVINGTAVAGSLLQYPIRRQTTALFDQVELYSPVGNLNWAHNGGFETGDLTSWGNTAGFRLAPNPTHSGSYSANGTAVGTTAALAQSIDGRPSIDSSTSLAVSTYIGRMTGTSSSDKADLWLGVVDSSPQANPLSIYYYFGTGTGTIPSNTTDTINHQAAKYGTLGQWLNLTRNLQAETPYFDATGHTGPYRVEALVLEVSAHTGSTTTAYFDDISIPAAAHPTYYATDSLNSTYLYNANKPLEGSFYFSVPEQQSILNVTTPNGTPLQTSDYTTQLIQSSLQITVPTTTGMKYSSPGNWRIYTTSKNALADLFATLSGSTSSSSSFDAGSAVNIASESKDPSGNPLTGANVTIFFPASTQAFIGKTNSLGWYNATNVVLPSTPGPTTLEAITVSSSYIGLRTSQLTINNPTPWAIIIYASIAAAALAIFSLLLLRSRRRKRTGPNPERTPSLGKNPPGRKGPTKP